MSPRIVWVTGASGGLGQAIVRHLSDPHSHVIIQYRRDDRGAREVADELASRGHAHELMQLDVRDPDAVAAAVDHIRKTHGRLDVLVQNAGVVADAPFLLMDEASWEDVIAVNLSGAYRVCRASARLMAGKRSGTIIAVASVAGVRASPYQANYSAAKAGMLGMMRTLARELGPRGIRTNTVIPGLIDVGMGARVDRRMAEAVLERVPLKRAGTADEVAAAVAFLASDAASYITGAELTIDGGLST